MNIDKLHERVAEFEGLITQALDEKYASAPRAARDHQIEMHLRRCWDVPRFVCAYLQKGRYPIERLDQLVNCIFDIKLELYYLLEVDMGQYNNLLYDRGYNHSDPRASLYLLLIRLSLDQTQIVKSRILWERIMNCIYYLETGETLDIKNKSKKATFFRFAEKHKHWKWLVPYESEVAKYDNAYRTGEVHKNSFLRAELMGRDPTDPNALGILLNRAMNCIWENVLCVVAGQKARHFTDLHMADGKIDPRYLE